MRSLVLSVFAVVPFLCLGLLQAQPVGIPFDTCDQDVRLVIVDQGGGASIVVKIYDAAGSISLPGTVGPSKEPGIIWQWPNDGKDKLVPHQRADLTFTSYVEKAKAARTVFLPCAYGSIVVESDKPIHFELQPVGPKW